MNEIKSLELTELAEKELTENGFATTFPADVLEAVQSFNEQGVMANSLPPVRDLRSLLWSSIDNETSRDLDQAEYVEKLSNGDFRLLVGIADVDAFVPKNSVIDAFAAQNTLSIYAGSHVFSMLPEKLSTDLTSLLSGVDRLAMVIEMIIHQSGDVETISVFRALLRNYAKLSYEEIGAWLDGKTEVPVSVTKIAGLEEQILLQQQAAAMLHEFRKQKGALEFETIEAKPVVENGKITALKIEMRNSAREIIENFMVTANVETAQFLEDQNVLSLRRVVGIPERWNRIIEIAHSFGETLPEEPDSLRLAEFLENRKAIDPYHYADLSLSIIKLLGASEYVVQKPDLTDTQGHFGLGVKDYTHSTAPNRRYADLIIQRLLKATISGEPAPYTFEELAQIADRCNRRESAARKVERQMRKSIAASVMSTHIGESFKAIVTGVTPKGTFARILNPPVDGRIIKGEEDLQVGETITVRLIGTDPQRGFIDFVHES